MQNIFMKRFAGLTLLLVTGWLSVPGNAADVRLQDADLAWDRGDYPTALRGYLAILGGAASDDLADAIALQTGELFKTTELTSDGGTPRFSPDGRYLTYELGRGVTRRTRFVKTDAPLEPLAELGGYGATFSPDSTALAYLKLDATAEMRELEASIETAETAERTKLTARLAGLTESAARITVRNLTTGAERSVETGALRKSAVRLVGEGVVVFSGSENGGAEQIYVASGDAAATAATSGDMGKVLQDVNAAGTAVIFTHRAQGRRGGGPPAQFGVLALPAGTATLVTGTAPAFSPDGQSLAFVTRTEPNSQLLIAPVASPGRGTALRTGAERLDAPSFSPDASRVAYQLMAKDDWELFTVKADGSGEQRLTREIQHDVLPRFLCNERLLGMIGEPRHRRSYVYDLASGRRMRLFHNNTVRTIAPEYEWVASRDGNKVVIVAERDGDTVSPQRGVYLTDLSAKISRD
jgi:dipeptidyl aminopeptidase/acylaminoacyl peptidase